MALVAAPPGLPPPRHNQYSDEEDMSTIPDPRSRAMSPAIDSAAASHTMHHPDLNDEVATLSTKLINAINYQTNLDDTLSATRCELDSSRDQIIHLESQVKSLQDRISQGILIEKAVADAEKAKALADLEEERRRRLDAEKEKKSIELELETLTTALFEEANNMVTSAREEARKELDLANRRNEQLKSQVADTEILLKSHQEQLAQLKMVMEHMSDDRTNSTAPPTPGLSHVDSKEQFGVDSLDNLAAINEDLPPSYPTSFTHLIHPVLRTDLATYDDFISLVRLSKMSPAPGSRVSSGSYGSLAIGLGLYTKTQTNSQTPSNSSTASTSNGTSPVTPNTPLSATSAVSAPTSTSTPLSDTRFYKRALSEDIEPCLRLDTAPGISWMARRSMLKSMCEGSLVVEPMPSSTKKFSLTFSCALCGENRSGDEFSRNHRFRISESNNAQRYPLCRYCLGRIRSCCDFIGFLRMLKDGHWRAEGEEAEKAAWEESVRLREQMFWCRIGGGVLPGPTPLSKDEKSTPRTSEDERRVKEAKISEEFQRTGEIKPIDVTPAPAPVEADAERTSTDSDNLAMSTEPENPPAPCDAEISSISSEATKLSAPSESDDHSASTETEKPSAPTETDELSASTEIDRVLAPIEVGELSTPTEVGKLSIATEDETPSIPAVTRKPLPSVRARTPSIPTVNKIPLSVESKPALPAEIKRPSTASSDKASKVSNIRMMFEKKKDTAEGLWKAAQDDAAAPPSTETKSRPEHASPASSAKTTTPSRSPSPGDSADEQKLSLTIPGSFE